MTQTSIHRQDLQPRLRYAGRLIAPRAAMVDAPPRYFLADPGRYQLYAGWFSPWAHRCTLVIALTGLTDVVRVSYVEAPDVGRRLRKAYQAGASDFSRQISVPTLWDGETRRVVTNDYPTLEVDLATEFRDWSTTGAQLYPLELRDEIDDLDRRLGPAVNQGVYRARGAGGDGARARVILQEMFGALDRRLANSRYLLGDELTLADVRLWVTLVRYDVPARGVRRIGARLAQFRNLWAYAQHLYEQEAFQRTTEPARFSAAAFSGVLAAPGSAASAAVPSLRIVAAQQVS